MTKELNESLDTLLKIKDILKNNKSETSVEKDDDRLQVLELSLDELRIIYSRLDRAVSHLRTRIVTYLGAGLALLSWLYRDDLFIPDERYGKVFYFLGLGLMVSGLGALLHALKPNSWSVPIESKLSKISRSNSKLILIELLVEEYVESMHSNISRYERRVPYYYTGFMQLLCGGILLLVIKSIGA